MVIDDDDKTAADIFRRYHTESYESWPDLPQIAFDFGQLHGILMKVPQKIRAASIRELDAKFNGYCEKKVNEAWDAALEEAAKVALCGHRCGREAADRIRALKGK